MAERLIESATLTLVGMVVVFIGLIILMLAIIVLSRLAPAKEEKKEEKREAAAEALEPRMEPQAGEKEAVAAIAIALAQVVEESEAASVSQPPRVAASGPGAKGSPWVMSGREDMMRTREKATRQWERLPR